MFKDILELGDGGDDGTEKTRKIATHPITICALLSLFMALELWSYW